MGTKFIAAVIYWCMMKTASINPVQPKVAIAFV
jgi:hypothetical protein